jgi:hypothetical protein
MASGGSPWLGAILALGLGEAPALLAAELAADLTEDLRAHVDGGRA